jgi:Mg2+-importing ATPase
MAAPHSVTAPAPIAPISARGLSAAEAARRLARVGPNEVASGRQLWVLRTLLGLVGSPLVLILLAASIVSGLLGESLNAVLIGAMIVLSVGLDFVQVFRSEQAAARLRGLVAPTANAWRDGKRVALPVRELVPGDVVDLSAGDLVPADAQLIEATTLLVDEAALTGESLPVEKRVAESAAGLLYAGTTVVSGIAQATVTATGEHTQFGSIARALIEKAPPTEFERGARAFGLIILRTVVGLVLFVFLVNALRRQDPLESLLFALALAVGLTPEFLPMIMTVTLSQGAVRMARGGGVIVKRLAAIENLGNMDVLCSDKTGTLTRGVVTLQSHVDAWGAESEDTLRWACINSGLSSGVRSHLDAAILAHDHPAVGAYSKRAELPFDFERRRVSVVADGPGGAQLITKGAPEALLDRCTSVDRGGEACSLTPDVRRSAEATLEGLESVGYHVLAVARKQVPLVQTAVTVADECELVLCGFAAFLDPPAPSVAATVAELAADGVAITILTGDSDRVARTICRQVGIPVDDVVLGTDLDRVSDEALTALVERVHLFARVTPAQKNRVIRALKRKGHVVGYLGDGINDAPSLHSADVGISVSGGVEVAKAAADVILLEPGLAAIHSGVREGRRSFGNISKYVVMGTSSNFGNMFSMAIGSAFLPFLPLLPAQILLNNFLYDLSQLTIPTDNVDTSYVAKPRKWDMAMVQRFMFGLGPVSSVFDFLTFGLMLWVFRAGPELFRAGWFVESLATQTLIIFVIRTAGNPFRSRPSTALLLSVCGSVVAGTLVVLSPLSGALGFEPLPPAFFAALAIMVAGYLVIVQALKRWVYAASGWVPDAR